MFNIRLKTESAEITFKDITEKKAYRSQIIVDLIITYGIIVSILL